MDTGRIAQTFSAPGEHPVPPPRIRRDRVFRGAEPIWKVMLRPLRDQIVVKPLDRKQSEIIQVLHSERPNLGIVVAVGPGKRTKKGRIEPLDVQVNDTIRYGDTNLNHLSYPQYWEGNQLYLVLQEADVCFVAEVNGSEVMSAGQA